MTLMVRDEADIVGAMLEHHREQGIDHVVITDNGSVDGTSEILQQFAADGFATVWHDPVHRKQQFATVTRMARYAASDLGADWVINADADEFWASADPRRTVRDELERVAQEVPYLTVPVVNLTGAPARDGSGLGRLRYRDIRSDAQLRAAGIPFPPTADAVHRGHPDVEVSQGNHFVSAPGWEAGGAATDALIVLHLPWRSWRQYEQKVRLAGQAYLSNPDLTPSPRHHGMQDFRRWEDGRLEDVYVAKHPTPDELTRLVASGDVVEDDRLAGLQSRRPPGYRDDVPYAAAERQGLAETGRRFAALEATADDRLVALREQYETAIQERDAARIEVTEVRGELQRAVAENADLVGRLHEAQNRLAARAADRFASMARVVLHRPRS